MKFLGLEERAAPRVFCRGQVRPGGGCGASARMAARSGPSEAKAQEGGQGARAAGLDPHAPAFLLEHGVENAVDDQVRVAAYGRGEVRVVRRGEGEVPEVFL